MGINSTNIPVSENDPLVQIGSVGLYAKLVGGTSQLFVKTDDGSIYPLSGVGPAHVVTAALGSFTALVNTVNLIPGAQAGPLTVNMPTAASAGNGTRLAIIMFNGSPTNIDVVPTGGDSTNGAPDGTPFSGTTVLTEWVSDGVSNWWTVSQFQS
jgi:hypothetical protein